MPMVSLYPTVETAKRNNYRRPFSHVGLGHAAGMTFSSLACVTERFEIPHSTPTIPSVKKSTYAGTTDTPVSIFHSFLNDSLVLQLGSLRLVPETIFSLANHTARNLLSNHVFLFLFLFFLNPSGLSSKNHGTDRTTFWSQVQNTP
jgi:hypothetical protein